MCQVLNISDFWKFVNFRKYGGVLNASGCNHERVSNIPGFGVCQISVYASVAQGSEYDWIWLNGQRFTGFQTSLRF